jgi:serine/threonine protein kinase
MTMNADSEKVHDIFADQLASFDDKLCASADSVDMLADIQERIGRLLAASGGSEVHIRKILHERHKQGVLRKETFQLVRSMLDCYITENLSTSPSSEGTAPVEKAAPPQALSSEVEPADDDDFRETAVIPAGFVSDESADSRVQVGSLLRDRYLLQERIAGGSMGVVYKALDRRLAEAGSNEHWVAVKVLSPQLAENGHALRALQQEAAKGRCLVHPNIVRFIDLDRDDDLYFLIMEWLEGRTLADVLDSKDAAAIDHKTAFKIVQQIGDALEYAHKCGIVHADVKPGNIMIMPNRDAKLFDFGVARVRQQHSKSEFDPGVLGALTPAYSSMQVLTGEDPVATDDVFSLSCLLYRLIAGYRVFGPRNAAEASLEGMKPHRLKELNDSQWRALSKGLAYSRVMRFASVAEFLDAFQQQNTAPLRALKIDQSGDTKSRSAVGKWLVAMLVIAGVGGYGGYRFGYLDSAIERLESLGLQMPAVITSEPPSIQAPDVAIPGSGPESETVVDEPVTASEDTLDTDVRENALVVEEEIVGPDPMLVEFSTLPPPTQVVPFSPGQRAVSPVSFAIREDGPDVIIDFVRDRNLSEPLTLRLEEVGFSGNRSPWTSGQFVMSNSGVIDFPAGQPRGRLTLSMASDPLREADQQSTLRLREIDLAQSEFAVINLTLEDDDQREFESQLPVNTIAFAASQASIRETDPAVQIDLVRFNPDDTTIVVGFSVNDVTATEGEDYFAPGGHSITFGPGQRSARLLVPLVQDTKVEGTEAFSIELINRSDTAAIDVYRRIVIMIRDDEPRAR